ncbi:uncharacterized protein At2g34160-like [Mangifera indica]|uniref:uncharacterized protein At2g34160-like n=1 Tax=Mangifera indica TaxID=29780 RepID=UPI001CFC259D|nr:uncharacterized protein At2g34160-like [Mangifera indica]
MEASTKVVLENAEIMKEEIKNKNDDVEKKEAAPVDPDNGEVINAVAAVVAINNSSAQMKKRKNRKKKSNTRIQVSNTKKPFIFYLKLAKSHIKQYNNVELSALGMAIPTVITIAEILKRDGVAINQEVNISTVNSKQDHGGSFSQKPRIQIILGKAQNLDETTTAADGAIAPNMESEN